LFVACVVAVGAVLTTTFALVVISPVAVTVLLAVTAPVTVKLANAPTAVKLEDVTVFFNAVPVKVSAFAGIVISLEPLNATPLINLLVASVDAVDAFPVTLPTTSPVCVPVEFPTNDPEKLPAVIVPVAVTLTKLGAELACIAHVVPFHTQVLLLLAIVPNDVGAAAFDE
jgi:hypothetical protein